MLWWPLDMSMWRRPWDFSGCTLVVCVVFCVCGVLCVSAYVPKLKMQMATLPISKYEFK